VLSETNVFGNWDQKQIITLAASVGVFFTTWFCLLLVKRVVWGRLKAFAEKTPKAWDDALLAALSRPVHFLIFLIAVSAGIHAIPNRLQTIPTVIQANKILFVLIAAWIIDRTSSVIIRHAALPGSLGEGGKSLLVGVVRILFFSIVILIILDTLGISITPLLASLGVGSIAVALALQDTLGNLFSGLYMLVDRPVRVGDYVKLDGTTEGYVRQIGWRSTRLELLTDNMIIIPNSKFSSSTLTNYNMPVAECIFKVEVGVAYDSNLTQVESVIISMARDLQRSLPSAVASFEPVVRYHTFADSSINLSVVLKARTYAEMAPLKHEFIKKLHETFKREKIDIPFPQRVVTQLSFNA
jgi:small-conductance mechanosensitive channel